MTRRLVPVAAALAVACASAAAARDLTVISHGGDYQQAQSSVFFKPFTAATGIRLHDETWDGGVEALRERKDPGSGWDVVAVRGDALLSACDDGLLEKLDWSAIGGKDHYLPQGVSECGVGAAAFGFVLAWDRDKFPATPTWADFWDVAKFPGKRGLLKGPRTNLEIALLADGVAASDVYRLLRTSEGIERAFRKLDQIRPYAVWWQNDADAAHILGTGEVLMTSATSGRIGLASRAEHRNFGMQWAGSLLAVDSWAVLKASPNLREAQQFLYFVGDSAIQARFTEAYPVAGLAKGALDGLPAELQALLSLATANQAGALAIDEAFWRDNLDKLSQRFTTWLAR